jgi:hypothetical protein
MTVTVIVFVSDSHEEAVIGLGTKEEKLINPPCRRPTWQPVEQESSQLPNDESQNQTKLGSTAA